MHKLFSAIAIGVLAGVIDVIPMLVQEIDMTSCLSAFVHWVVLGVLISYLRAPIPDWAKGGAIGFFSALSIVILIAQSDPKSILPILMTSIVLGWVVGVLSGKFAT
jgi:hypothetical protein